MAVTDEQIIERLRVLLGESDLETTTEKMLRKKLEEEFKVDMLEKKPLIRQEVEKYLAERGGEEEEKANSAAGKPKPKRMQAECLLSEAMQEFLGEKTMPRTLVVKRVWDYIKANNLQDPTDKRKIILDDKLKTLFTAPLNMFSMAKQLSRHCKNRDEVYVQDAKPAAAGGGAKRAAGRAADKDKAKKSKTSGD